MTDDPPKPSKPQPSVAHPCACPPASEMVNLPCQRYQPSDSSKIREQDSKPDMSTPRLMLTAASTKPDLELVPIPRPSNMVPNSQTQEKLADGMTSRLGAWFVEDEKDQPYNAIAAVSTKNNHLIAEVPSAPDSSNKATAGTRSQN